MAGNNLAGPFVVATVFSLASCAAGAPQALTSEDVPQTFTQPVTSSTQVWPQTDWWRQSGNAELTELIVRAQAENLDLAIAEARVMAAQAQTSIQRAALMPQVSASAQAVRLGGGSNVSSISNASQAANGGIAGTSSDRAFSVFGLNLGASYELDFWGLARANSRATQEALRSARFAREAVTLTIVSNVANNYLSVLALRRRIAIAQDNVAAINEILDAIKLRVATGESSRLDLAREQAQMEAVSAQVPVLLQQERASLFTLAILLGRSPEKFEISTQDMDTFQPPPVTPGLPAELLLRRPDVAAAEADLASAHANLVAARAAFLPHFTLTGEGQFASTALGTIFRGANFAWDLGANFLQTIFDGGRLGGQKKLALAVQNELIAAYRKAVINGYADVEISLRSLASQQDAEGHLVREVTSAREAFQITQLQYRQGVTDLLAVLQAQQTLFGAEDQLVQTKLARMQALVQLYQALGGGWTEAAAQKTQLVRIGLAGNESLGSE